MSGKIDILQGVESADTTDEMAEAQKLTKGKDVVRDFAALAWSGEVAINGIVEGADGANFNAVDMSTHTLTIYAVKAEGRTG